MRSQTRGWASPARRSSSEWGSASPPATPCPRSTRSTAPERYTPEIVEQVPAQELYNRGLSRLESNDAAGAADAFEELEQQYPYSEWARRALVMKAFSFYEMSAYDEAIDAASSYLRQFPGSDEAAYAQFILASSYYDQIPDVTRDQERTERRRDGAAGGDRSLS